ncbi:MAG: SAM-dependent methyltransferase [Alistipes sp.]|nr:SAM-dependent methyltransferase [Alistipes sp.]MBR3847077.1 SAM-dependent methyltransferase [Alistipes sp.]MBR7168809.1 SAM-dependent methyltransferase [Alistipes sp.]
MEQGVLYMIPCPIADETDPWQVLPAGNRPVMDSLDYFIVENVRSARRFLSKAGVQRRIEDLEFRELNEHTVAGAAVEELIAPLLAGRSAGVISEAGVPGVADPGALVVEAAHRHGIRVVPLVGPSSILLSVMASGLNGQSFAFNGYLPVKGPERQRAIRFFERRAHQEHQLQLFIEAPYRNEKLFEELLQSLQPETKLLVAMELTAPSEWIRTRTVAAWRKEQRPELQRRPAIFGIG